MRSWQMQAKVKLLDLEMFWDQQKCAVGTLIHQGGPMIAEEAQKFESLSNFGAILKMRQWDEAAKDVNIPVVDNQKFVNIIKNILKR